MTKPGNARRRRPRRASATRAPASASYARQTATKTLTQRFRGPIVATAAFDARMGEQFNPWPAPDLEILSAGRRNAPAMPSDLFGGAWPLVCDLAEGAGAPRDYVAITFLTAAASLIGGKRKAKPFATTD